MTYTGGVSMERERPQYERVASAVAALEIRDQRVSSLCGSADPLPGQAGRVPLEGGFCCEQLLERLLVAAIERTHELPYGRADGRGTTRGCEIALGHAWSREPGGADRDDDSDP